MSQSLKNKIKVLKVSLFIPLAFLLGCSTLVAQNISYSQYQNAAFVTNPALIGSSNAISGSVIHRSQTLTESLKYNSTLAMFSMPLLDAKKTRRWGGWGLSILNDEVKGGIDFRTQGISAVYAYNLPVSFNQYIALGMQAGVYQRNVSMKGLSTSSQWLDNVGYVPSASTGEALADGRKNYLSISAGALYYKEGADGIPLIRLGVAAFNVNKPDVSITDNKDLIPMKITAHGNVALMEVNTIRIQGEALYYRDNAKNTFHLGARASYYFSSHDLSKGSIDFKAGYRVNNAITTEVQLHQPNFTIGFAYDFGISSKESYRSPNDVPEFLFTLKKLIGGKKTKAVKKSSNYSTIGKVKDFYFDKPNDESTDVKSKNGNSSNDDDSSVAKKVFKLKHDFKFGFNESTLNEESKAYLDDMVALLDANAEMKLEVQGHTDNVGSEAANQKVSMQRAQVVVEYLIAQGVNANKLKAVAMGDSVPLVSNKNEAGRSLNRRVEFIVYNK